MDRRFLESLLKAWGSWAVRGSSGKLGYPSACPYLREFSGNTDGYGRSYDPGYVSRDMIDLDKAIKTLPMDHRKLLIARYQRQWSLRKIGREAGVSHTHIRTYLNQALTDLDIAFDNLASTFHNQC